MISTVLERHRLHQIDDAPLLRPTVLTALLHDIFYAAEKMGLFLECENFQLKTACSVLANLFWNVFDSKRSTSISLMELKLTLLILCELPVSYQDIINEHFQLTKDHNNCVTRTRMESIVTIFTKLLSYLGKSLINLSAGVQINNSCCYVTFIPYLISYADDIFSKILFILKYFGFINLFQYLLITILIIS